MTHTAAISKTASGHINPWEAFQGEREILISVVGHDYGLEPERRFDDILIDRAIHAERLRKWLDLKPSDIVIDLGSGAGLITPSIAPYVRKVYAMDISRPHLEYTAARFKQLGLANAETVHMDWCDFSAVKGKGVNKLFCTAVMIHFNLWDIASYLEQIHEVLVPGGLAQIDVCDCDAINVYDDAMWQQQLANYKSFKSAAYLVTWHSVKTITKIADRIGFDTTIPDVSISGNTRLLFAKR